MKNQQVTEAFVYGDTKTKTKHLFIENNILYSYGYHFPLCIRLKDCFIVNKDSYSRTTAIHKSHLIRSLSGDRLNFNALIQAKKKGEYKHIILMKTSEIRQFLMNYNKPNLTLNDLNNILIIKEI